MKVKLKPLMDKEVEKLLERSPHPLLYTVAMLVLTVAAVSLHSVFLALVAGFIFGSYFGNYRGRFAVMDAWRKQMDADYAQDMAELEAEYKSMKAETN